MNSRNKGKTGEREFARFLRSHGFEARRGVQYHGGADSPDVRCAALPFHVEVKRVERLHLRAAVAQTAADARGRPWLVAHRWNLGPWLITVRAEDFLALVCEAAPPSLSAPPAAPCGVDQQAEPETQQPQRNALKGT
jgi:hypothetical protein